MKEECEVMENGLDEGKKFRNVEDIDLIYYLKSTNIPAPARTWPDSFSDSFDIAGDQQQLLRTRLAAALTAKLTPASRTPGWEAHDSSGQQAPGYLTIRP